VRPSEVHSIGLFSHEFIPKGTVIWKFDGRSSATSIVTSPAFSGVQGHDADRKLALTACYVQEKSSTSAA
jgi:hypothetical protein